MNRGVLQSFPVQQMMAAGNPNWWWSINSNMRPPILSTHHQQAASASPFLSPPLPNHLLYQYTPPPQSNDSSPPSSSNSSSLPMPVAWSHDNPDHQFPEAWSQLLLGGFVGDDDKGNMGHFQAKKLENWEDQVAVLHHHQAAAASSANNNSIVDVKQETSPASSYVYGHEEFSQAAAAAAATKPTWSSPMIPAGPNSSPTSCVTSLSSNNTNNMLDFSPTTNSKGDPRHPPPDRSTSDQCNGNANGGALKKARVQLSSTQPTFKVRKEKLGDRITALHQLVSPFGKTDTASVLLEAIGYIRFLQNQIEALSSPYLGSGSSNMRQQQSDQGESSCLLPDDPDQLLYDNCTKRNGASEKDDEPNKDLRSRGLCLVPVSCTLQVGSDNGADYWAPAFGGGFR